MSTPAISVVMPAYNHENYVGEAIESVLNQSFTDIELVIIDDGSTDNTKAVIKTYNDNRLKYHYQSNQDAYTALNNGMAKASGEFISIINSDDVYVVNRLEAMMNHYETSGAQCLFSGVELIDDQSRVITDNDFWWLQWHNQNLKYFYQYQDLYAAFLNANIMITTSNLFMTRAVYETVGDFEPLRYLHDYDYIFRILNAFPDAVSYLDTEKLIKYRLHGSNTLSDAAVIGREQDLMIIRKNLLKKCPAELHDYLNIGIDRIITLEHELVEAKSELEAAQAAQTHNDSISPEAKPAQFKTGILKRLARKLIR